MFQRKTPSLPPKDVYCTNVLGKRVQKKADTASAGKACRNPGGLRRITLQRNLLGIH